MAMSRTHRSRPSGCVSPTTLRLLYLLPTSSPSFAFGSWEGLSVWLFFCIDNNKVGLYYLHAHPLVNINYSNMGWIPFNGFPQMRLSFQRFSLALSFSPLRRFLIFPFEERKYRYGENLRSHAREPNKLYRGFPTANLRCFPSCCGKPSLSNTA